jgi:hypothetical protein
MKTFTKEQARKILRPNVDSYAKSGVPTEEELTAKVNEMNAMSEDEKMALRDVVDIPHPNELRIQLEALERKVADLVQATTPLSAFYSLSRDGTATMNNNTVVAFDTATPSSATLASLNLTLNRGTFTSTKNNNLLLLTYQIMFEENTAPTGTTQAYVVMNNNVLYARSNAPIVNQRATILSGVAPIMLSNNDTFHIRVTQTSTENVTVSSRQTRLSIMTL